MNDLTWPGQILGLIWQVDPQIKFYNYDNNHFYFMLTLLAYDSGFNPSRVLKLW